MPDFAASLRRKKARNMASQLRFSSASSRKKEQKGGEELRRRVLRRINFRTSLEIWAARDRWSRTEKNSRTELLQIFVKSRLLYIKQWPVKFQFSVRVNRLEMFHEHVYANCKITYSEDWPTFCFCIFPFWPYF